MEMDTDMVTVVSVPIGVKIKHCDSEAEKEGDGFKWTKQLPIDF